MARHLVVAHQTAESEELRRHLLEIAAADAGAEFVLLVPATPAGGGLVWDEASTDEAARRRAVDARAHLTAAGLRMADARVGDADPRLAVADELLTGDGYATIVVATLPPGISRWLGLDLPARVRRMAPQSHVVHVVAEAPVATRG